MKRALLDSFAVAAVITLTAAILRLIYFTSFCDYRVFAEQAQACQPFVIAQKSFARATPEDSEFVCRTRHCLGPLGLKGIPVACHEDLRCICTPGEPDGKEVVARLTRARWWPIECTLDSRHPSRTNETGPCQRGLCTAYIPK